MTKGFLLTRQWQDTEEGVLLTFWFKTSLCSKSAVKIDFPHQRVVFFVQSDEVERACVILSQSRLIDFETKTLDLKSFEGNAISGIYFQHQRTLYQAREILQKNGIRCFEADIRPTERFLTERFITAAIEFNQNDIDTGKATPIKPSEYSPRFSIMSFDIETDYETNDLFSIAYVTETERKILIIGEPEEIDNCLFFECEKTLIEGFIQHVQSIDPDVFIGWSVVNFDFRFLQRKADALGIELTIGRDGLPIIWRKRQIDSDQQYLFIPGRVVLDGIDTLKSATFHFPSFSLDAVAQHYLKRGKLIGSSDSGSSTVSQAKDPLYKAKEIRRQFYEDKASLAKYNLEDCQLVWDIFDKAKLIDFAIERANLTGLEMDRLGGSVAAFDNLYLPRLHRKGFVAPNIGDSPGKLAAPGGYVMDSQPGFYQSVLVLDYKSLYPSIIRTYKIDPYGRIAAKSQTDDQVIEGYDGASFSKSENILPNIIETLWKARDRAKLSKNSALSQAIKIIMNSFYGVLGTPGCRIHDARLTSSITKRSHEIILTSVDLIEAEGYRVIYGDTDSVFVALDDSLSNKHAKIIGDHLTVKINEYWQDYMTKNYKMASYLEMEYETHFTKFFMPTVRGSDKGSKKRYAGMIDKGSGEPEIVFKGLEAVRTDWTELAKEFQQSLYHRIFNNLPFDEYIREVHHQLFSGAFDSRLIYRKRLRQNLSDYQKNIPPHAQAAIKAEKIFQKTGKVRRYKKSDWIEYVMTVSGAEAIDCQESKLDYAHYNDKQLLPIADTILSVLNTTMSSIVGGQKDLFDC